MCARFFFHNIQLKIFLFSFTQIFSPFSCRFSLGFTIEEGKNAQDRNPNELLRTVTRAQSLSGWAKQTTQGRGNKTEIVSVVEKERPREER